MKKWLREELRSSRFKRTLGAFAHFLITHDGDTARFNEAERKYIGNLYRPDQKEPFATWMRLLKEPQARARVMTRVQEILSDYGITPETVILKYVDLMAGAEEIGDYKEQRYLNDKLASLIGLDAPKLLAASASEKRSYDKDGRLKKWEGYLSLPAVAGEAREEETEEEWSTPRTPPENGS